VTEHLYTKKPPPWEYVELMLCRDVYHCTPPELDAVPWHRIKAHLDCLSIEGKYEKERLNVGGHGK
jgi:hypothetical protein